MVVMLLVSTFVIAFAVASIVVFVFNRPVEGILKRVVPADISYAWARYLRFAVYVVGIGGGVRPFAFEKYMTLQEPYKEIVPLTSDHWMLEVYETVIGTLQSAAIVLLVFFVFALIAVVIVRVFETRAARTEAQK